MNSYEQHSNENRTRRPRSKKNWDLADPYVERRTSLSNYDPYDLLCLAIIRQAVKDIGNVYYMPDVYQFWTSDWYEMLTINLPQFAEIGEKIRDQAIANHRAGISNGLFSGVEFSDWY